MLYSYAPYSIVGLTTAVYRRRVFLREGPYVNATSLAIPSEAASPFRITYAIYSFYISLESS